MGLVVFFFYNWTVVASRESMSSETDYIDVQSIWENGALRAPVLFSARTPSQCYVQNSAPCIIISGARPAMPGAGKGMYDVGIAHPLT